MFSSDCASVCLEIVRSEPVNQIYSRALNASPKGLKLFVKFDTRFQGESGNDPIKFMEKGRGQGHVTQENFKITGRRYALSRAHSS